MAIVKKTEITPKRPVIIVLYGTPGVGKTSLGNTCNNVLLLDCDRGYDRAINRQDTIVASSWKEVLQDEKEIKNYSTLVIDTAKAVLDDFLMTYVGEIDYSLQRNKLKAYGAIGDEFKAFINRRRSENIDLVIIAHAKEEKDGDIIKLSPDVTGQSKDLLLRIADQVGFMTIQNNKRTITFEPTDRTIGKNVARIDTVEIPDENDSQFKTFFAEIIDKVKNSIAKRSEEQLKMIEKIENLKNDIALIETSEQANAIALEIKSKEFSKIQQNALGKELVDKCKSIGIVFDKDQKKFVCTLPESQL